MGSVSGVVEIRPFVEADRAALRGLFGRAGEGSPPGPLWGHAESEAAVYLDPYMDLEPGSLFVAVADGALVGYLAGCPDGSSFPSENTRVVRFFERTRFVGHGPALPVPGLRYEGKRLHQQTMVRSA